MPRTKSKRKNLKTTPSLHTQKEIKARLPRDFYNAYICKAKCHETTERNNTIDIFLEDYINCRIDEYVIKKLIGSIDRHFEDLADGNGFLDDVSLKERMNVYHTILIKLLPLCESKTDELRLILIEKLFNDLCYILYTTTESYLFRPINESQYFDHYEYIREKIEWYDTYIEEYYNLLIQMCPRLIKTKITAEWSSYFDTIANTLNCAQQVLIFCQYYRLVEKKARINKKSTTFINSLTSHLSNTNNEVIVNANELISIYKIQISKIGDEYSSVCSIWYSFLDRLYSNYKTVWLNKGKSIAKNADHKTIVDIEEINKSANIFTQTNKLKPHERWAQSLSNMDYLPKIIDYLSIYAEYSKEDLSQPIIRAHSQLCIQVLIFIKNNDFHSSSVPGFIHKTAYMLFKRFSDDIILDLKEAIKSEKSLADDIEHSNITKVIKNISLNDKDRKETIAHQEISEVSKDEINTKGCSEATETPVKNEEFKKTSKKPDRSKIIPKNDLNATPNKIETKQNVFNELQDETQQKNSSTSSIDTFNEINNSHTKTTNEYNAKNLETEHKSQAQSSQETHEDDIQQLKSSYENQSQSIQETHKDDIRQLTSSYESQLHSMQETHKNNIQQLKYDYKFQLQSMQEAHTQALTQELEKFNQRKLAQEKNHEDNLKKQKEKLEKSCQKSTVKRKRKHDKQIENLKKSREASLNEMDKMFDAQLESLNEVFRIEKEKILNEQQERLANKRTDNELKINEIKYNQRPKPQEHLYQVNLSSLEKSEHLKNVIAELTIPRDKKFILAALREAGIEFYIAGGWVRNRLLGIPSSDSEDFDIIVNADAASLQIALKGEGIQPRLQPKLVILGNIDFWCEPWDHIVPFLMKRDLTINTFICDINGKVYDLLNAYNSLHFQNLVPLGENAYQNLQEDPVRILRYLRLSVQLNKQISTLDWHAIYTNAHLIKTIPLGLYLKNISRMFCTKHAVNCFYLINQSHTLQSVFPFLDENDISYLRENPMVYYYIAEKLSELIASDSQEKNHYAVLTLMMFIPILRHKIGKEDVDEFIRNNLLVIWPQEKNMILGALERFSLNQNTLWYYIERLKQRIDMQQIYAQQAAHHQSVQLCHNPERNSSNHINSASPQSSYNAAYDAPPPLVAVNYNRRRQLNKSKTHRDTPRPGSQQRNRP